MWYLSDRYILETGAASWISASAYTIFGLVPSTPNEDWFAYLHQSLEPNRITGLGQLLSRGTRTGGDLMRLIPRSSSYLEDQYPHPTSCGTRMASQLWWQAGKTDRYLRLRLIIFEVWTPTRIASTSRVPCRRPYRENQYASSLHTVTHLPRTTLHSPRHSGYPPTDRTIAIGYNRLAVVTCASEMNRLGAHYLALLLIDISNTPSSPIACDRPYPDSARAQIS